MTKKKKSSTEYEGLESGLSVERKSAQEALALVQSFPLDSPNDREDAGRFLGLVAERLGQLEEQRKSVITPLNEVVRRINSWFKPVRETLEAVDKSLRHRVSESLLAARARQDQALALVQAGAGEAPAEALSLAHAPLAVVSDNVSVREKWVWELTDPGLLPDAYWMRVVNTAMIDAQVKSMGQAALVPGVTVKQELGLTVRRTQ